MYVYKGVVVEHKAFSSLLDITCDAVAELDMTGINDIYIYIYIHNI